MTDERQLTDSRGFSSLSLEQQERHVKKLREKRKDLQPRNKKAEKPVKLPKLKLLSRQHELCYLGLPRIYQKLF
jgi:hypothetical protein